MLLVWIIQPRINMRHFAVNYKNANRSNERVLFIRPDTVSFISPCLILTPDTNKGPITILAVAPVAPQLYVSLLMDSWCVISGDATAPLQVSRASPTALLSPVTYLGGFFKKIPKKAFSFLVSSHPLCNRARRRDGWLEGMERGGILQKLVADTWEGRPGGSASWRWTWEERNQISQ